MQQQRSTKTAQLYRKFFCVLNARLSAAAKHYPTSRVQMTTTRSHTTHAGGEIDSKKQPSQSSNNQDAPMKAHQRSTRCLGDQKSCAASAFLSIRVGFFSFRSETVLHVHSRRRVRAPHHTVAHFSRTGFLDNSSLSLSLSFIQFIHSCDELLGLTPNAVTNHRFIGSLESGLTATN